MQLQEMQKERAQTSLGMRNVKAILQLRQSQQAEKMKEEKRKLVETLQVWFNNGLNNISFYEFLGNSR